MCRVARALAKRTTVCELQVCAISRVSCVPGICLHESGWHFGFLADRTFAHMAPEVASRAHSERFAQAAWTKIVTSGIAKRTKPSLYRKLFGEHNHALAESMVRSMCMLGAISRTRTEIQSTASCAGSRDASRPQSSGIVVRPEYKQLHFAAEYLASLCYKCCMLVVDK